MYEKLFVYFYVKKKRSELTSGSELQQSAEQNIWTKQEGSKSDLEKTAWHEDYELYNLTDTLVKKWRATVTIGTEPTDNIEEKRKHKSGKSIARPQIGARKRFTRRIQVRNFRALYVQYRSCTEWLSLVSIHQEISVRPETDLWSRHKTSSAGLAEKLGDKRFGKKAYKSWSHDKNYFNLHDDKVVR
jgi:hypothetical protein